MRLVVATLVVLLSAPALAQTDPREDDLFGEPKTQTREDEIFGDELEPAELTADSKALLEEERLQIGGLLYLRYMATVTEGGSDECLLPLCDGDPDTSFSNPNLLDLFMDARPNDRIRGFVRGRLKYDPVSSSPIPGLAGVEGAESLAPDFEPFEPEAVLDQLWLKFDVERVLFVTAGKQPVRWGATRIWNPGDVVNLARREPLTLFDERTGINALKLHVPIEDLGWNVIGLALLDEADTPEKLGAALRLETVFSTVELGLTGMVRQQELEVNDHPWIPKFAADVSAGVWDLDFTGEVATVLATGSRNEPFFELSGRMATLQAAGGVSWTIKYSAEDFIVAGGEYFYNSECVTDHTPYAKLLIDGEFSPFYNGRHYAAGFVSLPSPGNWDFTSFTLSHLSNLSDGSNMARFDYSTVALTWLTVQAFATASYGQKGGELRLGLDPLVPYQAMTFGINLKVDM